MSTTFNLMNYASNNRSAFSCTLWLAVQLLLNAGLLLSRPVFAQSESTEFEQLQQTLENHGFTIALALPPQRGSYGLLQVSSRTIWVNPVVFDLEIAVPTLVHEAVHAAQLCKGERSGTADTPMPLNLGLTPYAGAYRLYMRYTGTRRTLEMEAYTIQARADRVAYVTHLLNSRCGTSAVQS